MSFVRFLYSLGFVLEQNRYTFITLKVSSSNCAIEVLALKSSQVIRNWENDSELGNLVVRFVGHTADSQ